MSIYHLLRLKGMPIFEQLQLEEALLRCDERNWVIINEGSPHAIVMGISGKYEEHVNPQRMAAGPIPVIRRFSGGGTVVVDTNTIFYTLIGNRNSLPMECYPDRLLRWSEQLYAPAFSGMEFSLRENDYTLGNNKFGGNAQYITKQRWLHHTSMLWDFDPMVMEYLLMPSKMPSYRLKRIHGEFLCRLQDHFPNRHALHSKLLEALERQFQLVEIPFNAVEDVVKLPHRQTTLFVDSD
jgi:lipoate-protein ligase A